MAYTKLVIIIFFLSLCCSSASNAQGNSSFLIDNSHGLSLNFQHIENDTLPRYKLNTMATIISIVYLETMILGYSYLSTYTWGSYFVGGAYAGGAALVIGFYIFSDYEMAPMFTIPYTIGLTALSYYNFRFADSHSNTRKFWTNMIGFHASYLSPVAVALLIKPFRSKQNNVTIQPGIGAVRVTYKF
jgi:hypothetical protein